MLPAHFTEAWVHETHRVLGRRLLPYCLWHRLALGAVDSPFLSESAAPPELGDLVVAVRICRSRYDASGVRPFASVLGTTRGALNRARLAYLSARFHPPSEGARFVAYIRDYLSLPLFWQKHGTGAAETSGAPPDEVSLTARLMSAGVPETAAWMMPIGKANWYATTLAQQAGAEIRFRSESAGFLAGIDQLRADYQAMKKKRQSHA